jgi:hypothetical protein
VLFDFARRAHSGFGLAILLALPAVAPATSQPEQDKAAAQAQREDNAIERWNRMSPEERERELAKLPPARAQAIRQRIWQYNHMKPEEREALLQRYQAFSELPPDKQEIVRERLREYKQLPAERRPVIHREVEQLRLMTEAQRQARMKSEEFRNQFSVQEQQIIKDVFRYLPN